MPREPILRLIDPAHAKRVAARNGTRRDKIVNFTTSNNGRVYVLRPGVQEAVNLVAGFWRARSYVKL